MKQEIVKSLTKDFESYINKTKIKISDHFADVGKTIKKSQKTRKISIRN
ncbi:hypothetical protein KKG58_03640 [Patescibacteria group bacterium]|nr:hypothetical protein [Patescibacteria group bacterium]